MNETSTAILEIYRIGTPLCLLAIAFFLKRLIRNLDTNSKALGRLELAFASNTSTCVEKHKALDAKIDENKADIKGLKDITGKHTTQLAVINDHLNIETT